MTEIRIPFLTMFREPLADGRKTVTSRTKRYGHIDDTFSVYGMRFQLISEPYKENIRTVRDTLYKEEGFQTPVEFASIWMKIHPVIGLPILKEVWVHRFKRIDANLEKTEHD